MNDSLLSDLLDVEARTLRAKGSGADGYGRDAVGAGMKRRQLQGWRGRHSAFGAHGVDAAAFEGANK
ncbi:MAG TPA: hypothetical protein VNO35_28200 [Steroidobacteraceae bacterium]|nr:hypothetical protein [Steroidobacteraceae bacterium]